MPTRPALLTRRELILSLLLIAATLAVYAQVWKFGLVLFDDTGYVNPQVQKGLTAGGFRWAFVGFHAANWTPLTWLSLMLDTTIYGKWPGGYHITNALLHIANVLLVFAVFAAATRNTIRSAIRRRHLCDPSAARRIGRLGQRTQGRPQHVLRPAGALRVCPMGAAAADSGAWRRHSFLLQVASRSHRRTCAIIASATVLAALTGCGNSTSSSESPRIASRPDLTVKFDGKRRRCIVALSSEAQGSTISCDEVVSFVKDELRLAPGSIYNVGATSGGDDAEVAKVRANLNHAGYRFIGGSR